MIAVSTLLWSLFVLVVVGVLVFAAICVYRVELRRRAAIQHMPQPEEVWVQGNTILYIDFVGPHGVEWMTIDPISKSHIKHKDTWEEWHKRLRAHNVWYTGQRRPLGNN